MFRHFPTLCIKRVKNGTELKNYKRQWHKASQTIKVHSGKQEILTDWSPLFSFTMYHPVDTKMSQRRRKNVLNLVSKTS